MLLSVVIWGLNKGFDITDEGYYLLGYQDGQEIGYSPSGFQYVIRGFFGWMDLDIINVRILRLIISLISVLLLTIALKDRITNKLSFLYIFCFLGIGCLLSYTYGPQSLSYNSLISSILISILSLLLIGEKKKGFLGVSCFVFSGFLFSLGLLIKFPPVLVFLVAVTSNIFFISKWTHKNKLKAVLAVIIGFLLGLMLFSSFCHSIFDFYLDFYKGIVLTSQSSGYTLNTLAENLGFLFVQTISISGFLLFIFFVINTFSKHNSPIICFFTVSLLTVFFLTYYYEYLIKYSAGNSFPYLFFVLTYVLYKSQHYFHLRTEFEFKSSYLLLIFLFVFPFIGSIGTDNPFLSNSTFMISSWFGLVILVGDKLPLNSTFSSIMAIALFVFGSYLFYSQYVKNPYRSTNLFYQSESISNERVKVDTTMSQFMGKINEILNQNNFKKGDPIIALYRIPGLVYLLEGKSPGGVISLWDYRRTGQFLEELKRSKMDYSKSFFLIKNRYTDSLVSGLNELGLNFPNDYRNVGKIFYPKSNTSKMVGGWTCYIYAHKSKLNLNAETNNEHQFQGDLTKAAVYLKDGEYEKCIKLYNKILSIDPNNLSALNNLGLTYMRLKKYKEAVGYFQKAVELDPNFNLAKNNLKWAFNQLKSN